MPAHDPAKRRKAQRRPRQLGIDIPIHVDELAAAGWPRDAPPPYFAVKGYQRSAKGRTLIITLYETE